MNVSNELVRLTVPPWEGVTSAVPDDEIDLELMRCINEHAKRSYGDDLSKPDYKFYSTALYQDWYRTLLDELAVKFKIDKWNGPDDVSFYYTLYGRTKRKKTAEIWHLWLSVVGPFAFLCLEDPGEDRLRRVDVVMSVSGVTPALRDEAQLILGAVRRYGFKILKPAELEATFDGFTHPFGIFPVTMYVLLFGDDGVPWQRDY